MHASHEPVCGIGNYNNRGDYGERNGDGGVKVPRTSSEPGPGETNHANRKIGGIDEREDEEYDVWSVSRAVLLRGNEHTSAAIPPRFCRIKFDAKKNKMDDQYDSHKALPFACLANCPPVTPFLPRFALLIGKWTFRRRNLSQELAQF